MRRLRELYALISSRMEDSGRVLIDGKRELFLDTLDLRTFQMVLPQLERGDMELPLAGVLTPPGGVFVDVGANIGVLSLLALTDSVHAVYSFEPNPAITARLRKTRAVNPLAERWHLFECAVGAEEGRFNLFVDRQFSGTASLVETWQRPGTAVVEVPVVSLEAWFEKESPPSFDVLKMDVEGWEFAVLEGAERPLRHHRPYIWFEHNLPALHQSGLDANRVLNSLSTLGYEVYYDIGRLPNQSPLSRSEVDRIANARVNLLAVPEQRKEDFFTRALPQLRERCGD